jgi:hypothetical protein
MEFQAIQKLMLIIICPGLKIQGLIFGDGAISNLMRRSGKIGLQYRLDIGHSIQSLGREYQNKNQANNGVLNQGAKLVP